MKSQYSRQSSVAAALADSSFSEFDERGYPREEADLQYQRPAAESDGGQSVRRRRTSPLRLYRMAGPTFDMNADASLFPTLEEWEAQASLEAWQAEQDSRRE